MVVQSRASCTRGIMVDFGLGFSRSGGGGLVGISDQLPGDADAAGS